MSSTLPRTLPLPAVLPPMQPFAPGDFLVGATALDNPADCHAGRGRILQYDSQLQLRGALLLEGTTHLVEGLAFAPDGTLWAMDAWQWRTVHIGPDGRQIDTRRYNSRPFSAVHFLPDGNLLFTEALRGEIQPFAGTRYRPLPGHQARLGDGGLHLYSFDGELIALWEPEIHGGASTSLAISHSVLAHDGHTLVYTSAGGPRLMRFDVAEGVQGDDLRHGAAHDHAMTHHGLALAADGTLVVCMGHRLDLMTPDGVWLRTLRLPGSGWTVVEAGGSDGLACVGNRATGELLLLDLASGTTVARAQVAPGCIGGIARFDAPG